MGAYDTYEGEARCPRCGDVHDVEGQTKFFVPDFFGLFNRWFRPWVPQEIDFAAAELRGPVWDGSWVRVREPGDPGRLDLLADFSECFGCDCGARFAVVLRFRVSDGPPASAMLTDIELREHTSAGAVAVDFADGEETLWRGDHAGFQEAMREVSSRPPEARAAWLREGLMGRFPPEAEPEEAVSATAGAEPWFSYTGEVRCEACGERRRRGLFTLLAHPNYAQSFFGPPWVGGTLVPGMRLACDLGWLAEDVDRGYFTRLRHPVPEDRLTVIGSRTRRGCRCGAGPAAPVLRFEREAGALVVAEATLRVVRGAEDLADVDFAEAAYYTRDPAMKGLALRWQPSPRGPGDRWTREVMLAGVLAGLVRG